MVSNPFPSRQLYNTPNNTNKSTEAYLRTRNQSKFDRYDFDSLSNKFLSKLVIKSN